MRRVKDFHEFTEYTSLDRLIEQLIAFRDSLPEDAEPELRLRGCDVFGRSLAVSYMRPLTEEETAVENRYNMSKSGEQDPQDQ